MSQQEMMEQISELYKTASHLMEEYWSLYSHVGTWQFWYHIILLIIPLTILYIYISRNRFFEILFFGYTIHLLFGQVDSYMVRYGLWSHPYMIIPQIPFVLSIYASLIPVTYMLLYQYCTSRGKRFYLWILVPSVVIGILWLELHKQMNIVQFDEGITHIHKFFMHYILAILTYWITKLFLYIKALKSN